MSVAVKAEDALRVYSPRQGETADHSVPFCVAAALLDGAVTVQTLNIREIFPLLAIS
jgi:2-methylcitrate dehydratase PrpD